MRNWSERGRAGVLGHECLEVSFHGEVNGLHVHLRHCWHKWVACRATLEVGLGGQGLELGREDVVLGAGVESWVCLHGLLT